MGLFDDYQPLQTSQDEKALFYQKLTRQKPKKSSPLFSMRVKAALVAAVLLIFGLAVPYLHRQSATTPNSNTSTDSNPNVTDTTYILKGETGKWSATDHVFDHRFSYDPTSPDWKKNDHQEALTITYHGKLTTATRPVKLSVKGAHRAMTESGEVAFDHNNSYTITGDGFVTADTDTIKVTLTMSSGDVVTFDMKNVPSKETTRKYSETEADSTVQFSNPGGPIYENLGLAGKKGFQLAGMLWSFPHLMDIYSQYFGVPKKAQPVDALYQTVKGEKTPLIFLLDPSANLKRVKIIAHKPNGMDLTIPIRSAPYIKMNQTQAVLAYVTMDAEGQWTFEASDGGNILGRIRVQHIVSIDPENQNVLTNNALNMGFGTIKGNWKASGEGLSLALNTKNQADLDLSLLKNFSSTQIVVLSDDGKQVGQDLSSSDHLSTTLKLKKGTYHLVVLSKGNFLTSVTFKAT